MLTKKELDQIENNINMILDVYFDALKKGNDAKAHQAVDRLAHEFKKLEIERIEEPKFLH